MFCCLVVFLFFFFELPIYSFDGYGNLLEESCFFFFILPSLCLTQELKRAKQDSETAHKRHHLLNPVMLAIPSQAECETRRRDFHQLLGLKSRMNARTCTRLRVCLRACVTGATSV